MGNKHPEWSFSQCLRYAFFSGAGYADLEKISEEDQRRWCAFDPSELELFKRMEADLKDLVLYRKMHERELLKAEKTNGE